MSVKLKKQHRQYESYADSGVNWIGKYPKYWKVDRIGRFYKERNTKVSDLVYSPLSVTKKGIVPQLDSAAKSQNRDDRKLVKKNDFVINSRSDRKGSSGTAPLEGSVSLINTVMYSKEIKAEFSNYLLKNHAFIEEFYKWGKGIVADLWSTRYSEMKNITISVPPPEEQTAIANYLDQKTELIDRIITAKQKQIELLQEKRAAIINKAVTQGLDDSVELVDSSVDWIGKIPKGWGVKKLKYVVRLRTTKATQNDVKENYIALENIRSWTGEFIESEQSNFESAVNVFKKDDVLFGKLRPYLAKVYKTVSNGVCSSEFLPLIPKCVNSDYLFYLLTSSKFIEEVNLSTYGTKMPRANWTFIGSVEVPVPDARLQIEISDFLYKTVKDIKNSITLIKKSIELLNEYKSSLITNVVTGKVKISTPNHHG